MVGVGGSSPLGRTISQQFRFASLFSYPIFSQLPSSVFNVFLRINTADFLRYRKNVNLFLIL